MAAGKGRTRTGGDGRDQALQRHLVRLWTGLVGGREPPALDRWLARELSALDGLPRADRLLLGELLTDGVRFAPLVLFCEQWRQEGHDAGGDPGAQLQAWSATGGPELWRRLRRLAVPVVFFWVFMRKREEGAALPPIAPPGPEALEVWRAVKTWAPAAAEPAARALWAGLPPALGPLLDGRAAATAWTADDTLAFLDRHAARPPVWLRLADERRRTAVLAELAGQGFLVVEQIGPALAVAGPKGVYELACHRDGLVDVQDLASQRIGQAVDPRPGQVVWDCCAGAGGKSLQLASLLAGKGAVHATDLYENKLKDLRKRARRAGWANLRAGLWDGDRLPDFGPEVGRRGGFDRVLVDAPCSGSGTWRRHPDGRLRFAADQLPDLAAVQLSLLETAAPAVRPGGLLVYATCSWFTAENEDVVAAFRAGQPGFALREQRLHGNPQEDADTTFTAVLERIG
jgi:16S rRNA (cytosine967-C5)-methyltransferase